MKAIIEFDRNDAEDFRALKRAMQADEAFRALWKITQVIIPEIWDRMDEDSEESLFEELVDKIHFTIEEFDIDVELGN